MGTLVLAVLLRGSGPVTASQGAAAEDFYRLEELHEAVALDGTEYYVPTVFGPTGMVGWILGSHLIVRDVEAGSPADGRIRPSDVLFAVNGEPLGEEPLKTLGLAIDETHTAIQRLAGRLLDARLERNPKIIANRRNR